MAIHRIKDKITQELILLKKYQTGKLKPVSTGRAHLDDTLTGLLPGDIVVLAGASGAGKSFELQTLREQIMDVSRNPEAKDFIFLDYSFEMKLFNVVLRGLNKVTKKKKKDILLSEFSEDEKAICKRYIETLSDDRFYIEERALTGEMFEKQSREFLEEHKDKKNVFIAVDHMALFKNSRGDKKTTIDDVVEIVNSLKRDYKNVIFILLTQLNRSILARIADRDLNAMPNRADIFQSDTMFHIADYLIVVHNPFRLGINEYLKVNPETYRYLEDFFITSDGLSKKVSFRTTGCIFFHVLKIREGDVVFKDIYIEEISNENLEIYKKEIIDIAKDEDQEEDEPINLDNLD